MKSYIIALGLIISVAFTAGAYGQSGAKAGSSSKYNNANSAMAKKKARMIAKEEANMVRGITRRDFGEIKLSKEQRQLLKNLVHDNFQKITDVDVQMVKAIPAERANAVKSAYRAATRKGESESQAMVTSMMKAGLDEMVQEKVQMLSGQKEELLAGIRDGMTESFDDEQKKQIMAQQEAMNAGKEAMPSDKEAMSSEKEAMSSDKEAMSSEKEAMSSEKEAMSSENAITNQET